MKFLVDWCKRRFQSEAKKAPELSKAYQAIIVELTPIVAQFPAELKQRLFDRVAEFIATKRFEGCNGFVLDDDVILTISTQACILILGHDGPVYPKLKTLLVYPTTFSSVQQVYDNGILSEKQVHRLGESWGSGTVILAWDSVKKGGFNFEDGMNVALHEFAHQLDQADGQTDGAPRLFSREAYRSWAKVLGDEFTKLNEAIERRRHTLIDGYGASEPAEFFAVVTEIFFEKPEALSRKHPELFQEFLAYYRVDPRTWELVSG